MDEETKVDSQEETTESVDSQIDEEAATVVEADDPYESKTIEDYKELEKKNKELYERAKKAEALAKVAKSKPLTNETPATLTREEAILYAKGYSDEEVDLANKIAKINGTTIIKATEDELFRVKYEQRLKKEKLERASLSPSAGSGRVKADKPQGEMTREEHEAYYRKVMGL